MKKIIKLKLKLKNKQKGKNNLLMCFFSLYLLKQTNNEHR